MLLRRSLAQDAEPDAPGIEPAIDTLEQIGAEVVAAMPLIAVALVLAGLGIVAASFAARSVQRALGRRKADATAIGLVGQTVRLLLVTAAILLALAVAGVPVGPALAGLGVAGLAVALALQPILENFIAGVVLLMRKPFRAGDQIMTNEIEGTVQEIDLRVTRLVSYEGETLYVPNILVFQNPMVNFTRRGSRRSRILVGVDYRDDHDAAREVIREALGQVEGVFAHPEPEVWLTELGESSVDFELVYWTLPHMLEVRRTQDRVLAAVKRAIEDAGMTIPWPIRTLVLDAPVEVAGQASRRR